MNFLFLIITMVFSSHAETIIVGSFDTQFDLSHKGLYEKAWINTQEIPNDNIDNDHNGYIDDIHGWNFADKNNSLFDYNPLYSEKNIEYAEYAMRRRAGIATPQELEWLKLNDETIGKQHRPYISYLHGTSSSYVNLRDTKNAKFISLRMASKEEMLEESPPPAPLPQKGEEATEEELAKLENDYINEVYQMFSEPIIYASKMGARVIQFGYMWQLSEGSSESFQMMVYEKLGKIVSKARAQKLARAFYEGLVKKSEQLFTAHPQILFMLPAGNSAADLDKTIVYPHFTAGENKIIVGASIFREDIAPFSSYGKNSVDAIIPTANYYVAVPHNRYMLSSATSVSVVILTNLAVLILEENPALTSLEVKNIILSTVIMKDSLKDKLKVPGIIYNERALEAARNSKFMSVNDSIQRAFQTVKD